MPGSKEINEGTTVFAVTSQNMDAKSEKLQEWISRFKHSKEPLESYQMEELTSCAKLLSSTNMSHQLAALDTLSREILPPGVHAWDTDDAMDGFLRDPNNTGVMKNALHVFQRYTAARETMLSLNRQLGRLIINKFSISRPEVNPEDRKALVLSCAIYVVPTEEEQLEMLADDLSEIRDWFRGSRSVEYTPTTGVEFRH